MEHQIHKIIDTYIPKRKHNTNPWVLHLIHLKKEAWNRVRRSNAPTDWESYKKLNNSCKNTINKKHTEYINSALEDYNEKKLWKLVNIRNDKSSSFPD